MCEVIKKKKIGQHTQKTYLYGGGTLKHVIKEKCVECAITACYLLFLDLTFDDVVGEVDIVEVVGGEVIGE